MCEELLKPLNRLVEDTRTNGFKVILQLRGKLLAVSIPLLKTHIFEHCMIALYSDRDYAQAKREQTSMSPAISGHVHNCRHTVLCHTQIVCLRTV